MHSNKNMRLNLLFLLIMAIPSLSCNEQKLAKFGMENRNLTRKNDSLTYVNKGISEQFSKLMRTSRTEKDSLLRLIKMLSHQNEQSKAETRVEDDRYELEAGVVDIGGELAAKYMDAKYYFIGIIYYTEITKNSYGPLIEVEPNRLTRRVKETEVQMMYVSDISSATPPTSDNQYKFLDQVERDFKLNFVPMNKERRIDRRKLHTYRTYSEASQARRGFLNR